MYNFRNYVPPPKAPKRTPADYARIGKTIIALGAVFFIGSFAYMRQGSTMSSMQALVASFPMLLIFVGFGAAIWKQGMAGLGPMIAYLSAVIAACGAAAAWLWGT
ncbi:hypothetical protein [Pseudorhodoplanes sinuspersici]|uniref:Uncharacterized protein n=1 Tax=Pseudorhodoplanes sinuspersici TaxID=1235591 RepID=A0A1W6ZTR3_9HYPH|nr:hypothetical protein [Pseudorhodoplanes sinuspersici]ARQ00686.1 hypothetical protein CAK95_17560 [Pseudorhodoplanes sinuspersici]RKE72293.1 hypothetical protein DFP91_0155 [Pseudorhodoplanes sinuspersici]